MRSNECVCLGRLQRDRLQAFSEGTHAKLTLPLCLLRTAFPIRARIDDN